MVVICVLEKLNELIPFSLMLRKVMERTRENLLIITFVLPI